MKLTSYLAKTESTQGEFARQIGVTRQSIWLWTSGRVAPSRKMMRKIIMATDGMVTRKDFNGHA